MSGEPAVEWEPVDPAVALQPVELLLERRCAFKAKPLVCREGKCGAPRKRKDAKAACPACGSKKKPIQRQGCATCGGSKHDVAHYGAPPSLNVLGSGDPMAFQAIKTRWTAIFAQALEASGMPRGLGRVVVEGEVTFPDRTRRDQGNYRVLIEKALGDTLVNGWWETIDVAKVQPGDVTRPTKDDAKVDVQRIAGGWLEDDDWTRYEFGGLAYAYEAGASRLRLALFPSPPVVDGAEQTLFAAVG